MSSRTFRILTANTLLGVAYFGLVLDWLWLALVALPRLIETGKLNFLTTPPTPQPEIVHPDAVASSPLMWLVVGVATLGILIMTVVVLIKIPRAVVQTGQKVVVETAEAVLPVLTHHKQIPAKKKRLLSRRLMLVIQMLLSTLPLVVCVFLPPYHELTREIIITIALWLSTISAVGFIISRLVSPEPTTCRTK